MLLLLLLLACLFRAGLLKAYAAAAQTAADFFSSNPQLPRASEAAAALQAADQLLDHPAHVFAAASNFLMLLGNTLVQLVPSNQLLSAQSLLQDTTVPAATLAMALARAYACDAVFVATVMWQVLAASGFFVGAAVSGQAGRPFGGVAMTVRGLAVGRRCSRDWRACMKHVPLKTFWLVLMMALRPRFVHDYCTALRCTLSTCLEESLRCGSPHRRKHRGDASCVAQPVHPH
jgi:hypothetical protein